MTTQSNLVLPAIKVINKEYGLHLTDTDIYINEEVIYVSTTKIAELLRTSHHNFSNQYAKPLMKSGVDRVVLGRHKYYNIQQVLDVIACSIKKQKTIFEVCEIKIKAKKKRKR